MGLPAGKGAIASHKEEGDGQWVSDMRGSGGWRYDPGSWGEVGNGPPTLQDVEAEV